MRWQSSDRRAKENKPSGAGAGSYLADSQFNKLINILLSPSGAASSANCARSKGHGRPWAWENGAIPLATAKRKQYGHGGKMLRVPGGPGGYIYKSKVALNFSLLDVVARITTRTMSISARDARVSSQFSNLKLKQKYK